MFTPAILQQFQQRFGDQFSTSQAVRAHHGQDESAYDPVLPDAVLFARSTQDVVDAVQLCDRYHIPLVPFGAGTSLEGHVLPVQGGLSLDLGQMDAIVALHPEDFTVTVQAGVLRLSLNEAIRHTGLYFPIDPGANASIGGMLSTRASGTTAVQYGTMRDNVLSLTVVTAQGQVVKTSQRAPKSSAGYDLTRLFVGSEGTLGVIVEATLKLHPIPDNITAATCAFPTLEQAVSAVVAVRQLGMPIGRVEFLDANAVAAVNAYSHLTLPVQPTLFFEFHGQEVASTIETVQSICDELGGTAFAWARHTEERNRLWTARHNTYFACLQLRPGARSITTDVCVPISQLADCVEKTAQDLANFPHPWVMVGHVGDGNFHVLMMIDPASPSEREAAEVINQALVSRAIAAGGTCTGEHGIGLHKKAFLRQELGEPAMAVMQAIKTALDPKGILNPGKVL